jgi:hypothetical protein
LEAGRTVLQGFSRGMALFFHFQKLRVVHKNAQSNQQTVSTYQFPKTQNRAQFCTIEKCDAEWVRTSNCSKAMRLESSCRVQLTQPVAAKPQTIKYLCRPSECIAKGFA